MAIYDPKSRIADEFINHEEILQTLDYAEQNKHNEQLISEIIEKAKERKGLTHREASVLLACDLPEKTQEIFALAEQIKKDFYGNRIVMFAPLYLSNYCVNGCTYCPYHLKNKHIARKKLTGKVMSEKSEKRMNLYRGRKNSFALFVMKNRIRRCICEGLSVVSMKIVNGERKKYLL